MPACSRACVRPCRSLPREFCSRLSPALRRGPLQHPPSRAATKSEVPLLPGQVTRLCFPSGPSHGARTAGVGALAAAPSTRACGVRPSQASLPSAPGRAPLGDKVAPGPRLASKPRHPVPSPHRSGGAAAPFYRWTEGGLGRSRTCPLVPGGPRWPHWVRAHPSPHTGLTSVLTVGEGAIQPACRLWAASGAPPAIPERGKGQGDGHLLRDPYRRADARMPAPSLTQDAQPPAGEGPSACPHAPPLRLQGKRAPALGPAVQELPWVEAAILQGRSARHSPHEQHGLPGALGEGKGTGWAAEVGGPPG